MKEEYTVEEPWNAFATGWDILFLRCFMGTTVGCCSGTGVSSKYAGTRLSEGTVDGLYTIEFHERKTGGRHYRYCCVAVADFVENLTVGER